MDELKELLEQKIFLCASSITKLSTVESDAYSASAVEHLTKALLNIEQIKERKGE
jgi:hypothetical protein